MPCFWTSSRSGFWRIQQLSLSQKLWLRQHLQQSLQIKELIMSKMTKQDQISQQLIEMNFVEEGSSKKYRKFTHPQMKNCLFVGRHGALRYGRTQSESRSVNPQKVIPNLQSKYYKGEL